MSAQFVDLFDRERYGINFRAALALFGGLMTSWVIHGARLAFIERQGGRFQGPDESTVSWVQVWLESLPGVLIFTGGLALIVIALAHALKKDVLLPVAAGLGLVAWGILFRATGVVSAPAFSGRAVLAQFAAPVLILGGVAVGFRLLDNKLEALLLGFVGGSLLHAVLLGVAWSQPPALIGESAVTGMFTHFIAAVLLFAAISRHLGARGVGFNEFGMTSTPRIGAATEDVPLGKIRRPLTTMLLMLVTANLYVFGWIYRVYKEIRARVPNATSITPGKALGFLFIPVFNLLWAIWLFIDLPRAIGRMEGSDPPAGVKPDRWLISGLLVAAVVAGIVGRLAWPWALLLNVVLLWGGVLISQSALNSHWRVHRSAASAATS
jgi:hypothetical protein